MSPAPCPQTTRTSWLSAHAAVAQRKNGRVPAVVAPCSRSVRDQSLGRGVELVAPLRLRVRAVAAAARDQKPAVREERMPAAQDRVARRRVRRQVRLVDRVFERRRRRVIRVPEQRRLVGGDEQHLSGVQQRCVDDAVVAARSSARDRLREDRPAPVDGIAEEGLEDVKVLGLEGLDPNKLVDVAKTERERPVAELDEPALAVSIIEYLPAVCDAFRRLPPVMIHLGIRRRKLLVHQILFPHRAVQEGKDPAMDSRVQLDIRSTALGRQLCFESPFSSPLCQLQRQAAASVV